MHYIISHKILYKTNGFLIAKIEVILLLIKSINKKQNLYIIALNKKDLALDKKDFASIKKAAKIPGKNKNIKMLDVRHIFLENKHIISSQLKSEIQSIQNRFKLIKFNYSKKKKVNEPVD